MQLSAASQATKVRDKGQWVNPDNWWRWDGVERQITVRSKRVQRGTCRNQHVVPKPWNKMMARSGFLSSTRNPGQTTWTQVSFMPDRLPVYIHPSVDCASARVCERNQYCFKVNHIPVSFSGSSKSRAAPWRAGRWGQPCTRSWRPK